MIEELKETNLHSNTIHKMMVLSTGIDTWRKLKIMKLKIIILLTLGTIWKDL